MAFIARKIAEIASRRAVVASLVHTWREPRSAAHRVGRDRSAFDRLGLVLVVRRKLPEHFASGLLGIVPKSLYAQQARIGQSGQDTQVA